jgi:hypothetical protein
MPDQNPQPFQLPDDPQELPADADVMRRVGKQREEKKHPARL